VGVDHRADDEVGERRECDEGDAREDPIAELRALIDGDRAAATSAGRCPGLLACLRARLVRFVTQLLLDQIAVVVGGRQCSGHTLGFDISHTTRPAAAEGVPDIQRPHETEPLGADTLDRLMVRPADRSEQPLAAARDAGVHRGIVGGEIDAVRQRRAAAGHPILLEVDLLGFGCGDLANRPERFAVLAQPSVGASMSDREASISASASMGWLVWFMSLAAWPTIRGGQHESR
jgi:hypothetical protein